FSLSLSLSCCVLAVDGGGAGAAKGDAPFRPLGVNSKGTLVFERPRDHARVLWIPAGAFLQNDYFREQTDEPESHAARVAGFAIDETEVTARQFADFLNATKLDVDEAGHPLI